MDELKAKQVIKLRDAWFKAAQNGQCDELKRMVGNHELRQFVPSFPDLEAQWGRNALMISLEEGHTRSAHYLLPITNLSTTGRNGWSILVFAIRGGDAQLIEKIWPGSDLTRIDHEGWTPLMHAAYRGHLEALLSILPGSNINTVSHQGENALMLAVQKGEFECVQMLAPLMGDFNQVNKAGYNVIKMAAYYGYGNIAEYLSIMKERKVIEQDVDRLIESRGGLAVTAGRRPAL